MATRPTTHACPTGTLRDLVLPCCNKTLDQIPPGDRATSLEERVTRGGES